MTLELKATTQAKQLLKLVSVVDDAIDWGATYAELGDDAEDADQVAAKQARYHRDGYAIVDLRFADGKAPTVFVFEHPSRVDVDRKIRHAWTQVLKPGGNGDVWTDIWNELYLGKEEGLVDVARETPPRQGDTLTTGFFQALHDAGVFSELGQAVFTLGQRGQRKEARDATEAAKKK